MGSDVTPALESKPKTRTTGNKFSHSEPKSRNAFLKSGKNAAPRKIATKEESQARALEKKNAYTNLSNVVGHQDLEDALRADGRDKTVKTAKAEIENIDAEDLILSREYAEVKESAECLTSTST